MRPARALWVYLIFVFVGAALLAPWVHYALIALSHQSASWSGLAKIPFRRVIDRCLLILALLGLWPLVKALGLRSLSEIGWKRHGGIAREIVEGLAVGSVLLLLAAGAALAFGAAQLSSASAGAWAKQILSALATAVVVAILEETLFRGAIYSSLRRAWNETGALWMSSGLYAILHFFGRPESPATIEWSSGFLVLGRMLQGFTEFQTVVPGFFSLTLLGVIFALSFRRTGALFLSMGIHAALIFWVKLFGFASHPNPTANTWFWGTAKLIDGWFAFFLLLIAALYSFRRRPA